MESEAWDGFLMIAILPDLWENWTYSDPRRRNHSIWKKISVITNVFGSLNQRVWKVFFGFCGPYRTFHWLLSYQSKAGTFSSKKEKGKVELELSPPFLPAPLKPLPCASSSLRCLSDANFQSKEECGHANSSRHLGFFSMSDILSSSHVNRTGLKTFYHKKILWSTLWIIA